MTDVTALELSQKLWGPNAFIEHRRKAFSVGRIDKHGTGTILTIYGVGRSWLGAFRSAGKWKED